MSSSYGSPNGSAASQRTHTPVALIAVAWTLVGVPLAYGLVRTVQTASSLFTG